MNNKLIRLKEVMTRTGLSRSSIYAQIQNGTFPKSISIGERSVAWIEQEISDWIDAKISASRQTSSNSITHIHQKM